MGLLMNLREIGPGGEVTALFTTYSFVFFFSTLSAAS